MKFEQPAWLITLVLVPLFVTGALLTTRLRRKQWAAFVSSRLRPRLLRRGSPIPRWVAFSFLMLALVMLAFTLARPQTTKGREAEVTRGRNVIFVVDCSRSMLAKDLKPDRLTQAKALCHELSESMPNDRIGAVSFAGEPFLSSPLTVDHDAVLETIDDLDIDSIPVQGSNLAGAMEMAMKTLKETGQKENAVILLTDGEEDSNKMSSLASKAKDQGVYIFAVAFGTEQGDFIPDPSAPDGHHRDKNKRPVVTKLNLESLKTLTSESGGRVAVATSAADIPNMVMAAVKDLDQFELAGRERVVPMEHFQYFLLPAILLLIGSVIAGTRWRPLAPVGPVALLLVMFLLPMSARGSVEDHATELLKAGKNQEAAKEFGELADQKKETADAFRFRLAQGTAAYRAGDMDGARKAFSEALRSSDPMVKAAAHHGMGNVLFEDGWRSLSDDVPYPDTLKPTFDLPPGPFDNIIDNLLGRNRDDRTQEDKDADPMAPFDEMVQKRVIEWLKEKTEANDVSDGSQRFNSVVNDWIDAVKHYDSAVAFNPKLEESRSNRALDVKYLKRLRDLLNQVQESAKMMGQGSSGQGQEGDDEGDGQGQGRPGNGRGKGNPNKDGKDGDQKDKDGNNGDKKNDKDGKGNEDGQKNSGGKPKKGETAEDTARRLLKENSDFEKGAPIQRGHFNYGQPDKDW